VTSDKPAKRVVLAQSAFVHRMRIITFTIGFVLLLMVGTLYYLRLRAPAPAQQPSVDEESGQSPDVMVLTHAPSSEQPADPSQLVPPEILQTERHGQPTVTDSHGKRTVVDRDVLAKVLEIVKNTSEQELSERVDKSITWESFGKERRDRIKGRVCRFQGTLRELKENPAVKFPELGIEHFYEGRMDDSMGRWYSFYCFEKPEPMPTRTDLAEVTGVFYKLIQYTSIKGETMVTPLIVARTVKARKLSRGTVTQRAVEKAPPWALYAGLIGGAAAVFVVLTILTRRKRESPRLVHRSRISPKAPDT
jgi:hypothetical protein